MYPLLFTSPSGNSCTLLLDCSLITHNFSATKLVYHFFRLQNSKYKVLNRDQWCNVLEFSRSINPDLSNYDEDGACKFVIIS